MRKLASFKVSFAGGAGKFKSEVTAETAGAKANVDDFNSFQQQQLTKETNNERLYLKLF